MHRRCEYEKLMNEMYSVHIESNLASPLAGSATIEICPDDTVRKLVCDFLFSLEKHNAPGLAVYDKYYNKLDWDTTVESQGIKEGSKLYLVYDGTSYFQPVHLAAVGISTIIIATVLFMTSSILFGTTGGDIPFDYGIVIDAGSTHTEAFLYQWSGSKFHGTGKVYQKDFCRIDAGIAEGSDPKDLISCVNNITGSVPDDVTTSVTLNLGATAGMRLLNISNPLDAHLILTAIKYALKTTSVKEGTVKIIQGKDEGLFSWITTNFLSETLNQDKVNSTYGALDLGGGSTQVAFALNPDDVLNNSSVQPLKLYGYKYFVFSRSFLCFGLSQSSYRKDAIIFMDGFHKSMHDPCLPTNYSITLSTTQFFGNPCIQNENITNWLLNNTFVKELQIFGTSNYDECQQLAKDVVDPVSCKNIGFRQCLSTTPIAVQDRKFMAFSSYYYIVNYISPNSSLEAFLNATKYFCSLSYEQIKSKAQDESELKHLLTYCFGAVYVSELLKSTYGFSASTWKNILFQQSIRGADVGWSLGFMINASNAIPEEEPNPPIIKINVFVPLLIISILMFVFASVLLQKNYKFCKKRKRETLLESIA